MGSKCRDCGGPMLPLFTSIVCRDDCSRREPDVLAQILRKIPPKEHRYITSRWVQFSRAEQFYVWHHLLDWYAHDGISVYDRHLADTIIVVTRTAEGERVKVEKSRSPARHLSDLPDWVDG